MKNIVFLNGKFMPQEEAKLSALAPGFLYGWGLFETMRSLNRRIVHLDAHLERLANSSSLMHIRLSCPIEKLKKFIQNTVAINLLKDAYVRLSLWKSDSGTDTLIIARKYIPYPPRKYRKGFKAYISSFRQNEGSFLSRIKSTSYALNRLAYLEAKKKGFDEAVILNSRGYISEGSRSNLFFIKKGALFTPSLECGCLEGITRKAVLNIAKEKGISSFKGDFTLQDLFAADEAFLTNSLMGIMPIASLAKSSIGKGSIGRITRKLKEGYCALLYNGHQRDKATR